MFLKGYLTLIVSVILLLVNPSPVQASGLERARVVRSHHSSSISQSKDNLANGGSWRAAFKEAKGLLSQMTVEEKVNITSGFPGPCSGNTGTVHRLKIPSFCLNDSPTGVGGTTGVSQFPAEITVGATFDKALFASRAAAIAEEFVDKGVNIWLGPVTGGPLGRSPLNGRNWESFGADEYLVGEASFQSIKAAQEKGIVTCAKHYTVYEQETLRRPYVELPGSAPPEIASALTGLPYSSNVDDRTFHELYLRPFAEAARAGTGSVMCSYNRINGTHACEDNYSLNEVLKGELGFQGSVLSDWGGTWSTSPSANAGLDISMPGAVQISSPIGDVSLGNFFGDKLVAAVQNGSVSEKRLDDMVLRILTPIIHFEPNWRDRRATFQYGASGGPASITNNVRQDHYKIIRKIGTESVTLLKNDRTNNGGLPLKSLDKIGSLAVIGEDAGQSILVPCSAIEAATGTCSIEDRYIGTLTSGGGSGFTNPSYTIDPLGAISQLVRQQNGPNLNLALDNSDLSNVGSQAAKSDAALVFVNSFQSEAVDRTDLKLNKHGAKVIKAAAANNNNTIVIIHSGGPVVMEDWIENENITAVLFAYYPGQESGNSLLPVILGKVSPSGKLPFTLGKKLSDYPPNTIVTHGQDPQSDFKEKLLIDYKWFDAKKINPRFEFGFGLSYSHFTFGKASISNSFKKDNTSIQLTNEKFTKDQFPGKSLYDQVLKVEVDVTNSGHVDASEVAQVYVEFPRAAGEPPSLLRGFEKLHLAAGETGKAIFSIRRKDISVWDTVKHKWTVPSGGKFKFKVGNSSRNFKTSVSFTIQ